MLPDKCCGTCKWFKQEPIGYMVRMGACNYPLPVLPLSAIKSTMDMPEITTGCPTWQGGAPNAR